MQHTTSRRKTLTPQRWGHIAAGLLLAAVATLAAPAPVAVLAIPLIHVGALALVRWADPVLER